MTRDAHAHDSKGWRLLIHGGAGLMERAKMTPEADAAYRAGLDAALKAGADILAHGGSSLDAVTEAVRVLEDDPQFNAGRGAVLNRSGEAELDAAIMDGRVRAAGAVANARTIKNPILAARAVMTQSPHVLFAGAGADDFAKAHKLEIVPNSYFVTPRRQEQLKRRLAGESADKHGTVGAVAVDLRGNVAAATSTGGMTAKAAGRVGDSPIIGAGTYADNAACAVSATGHGEYFIRVGVARMICVRMQFLKQTARQAAEETLAEVAALGGDGGVIVVAPHGDAAFAMNTPGMFRGEADAHGRRTMIFADEN